MNKKIIAVIIFGLVSSVVFTIV